MALRFPRVLVLMRRTPVVDFWRHTSLSLGKHQLLQLGSNLTGVAISYRPKRHLFITQFAARSISVPNRGPNATANGGRISGDFAPRLLLLEIIPTPALCPLRLATAAVMFIEVQLTALPAQLEASGGCRDGTAVAAFA